MNFLITLEKIIKPIFRFFASLRLAIFTLSSLIIILSVATIIESKYGAAAAKIVVYDTGWFTLLLILLAINVCCAAVDRYPWKKKHIGFVTTHMGIILILAGSLLTQQYMIDGQMAITEGKEEKWVTLADPILYVYDYGNNRENIFDLKPRAFAWSGAEELFDLNDSEVVLKNYFPKSKPEQKIVSASEGPPALKAKIYNSFVEEEAWLLNDGSVDSRMQVGPAKIVFSSDEIAALQDEAKEPMDYIEILWNEKILQVSIPEKDTLPYEKSFEGVPFKLTIKELFSNAFVEGKKLIEKEGGEGEGNPAAILSLESEEGIEKHTVFSNFPDFPTIHGQKSSLFDAKIHYRMAHGGSKGELHELRFVQNDEELSYQVLDGRDIREGEILLGEEYLTGWMDLKFKVVEFHQKSAIEFDVKARRDDDQSENSLAAIQLMVEDKSIWLPEGISQKVKVNDQIYLFLFGRKKLKPGFRLHLEDFKLKTYQGSERPASFESDVILRDFSTGETKEALISMNEPLIHEGFRIYQSGYILEPGQPEMSVFTVGKDPGVPLKYAGAAIMALGILLMFYTKAYSSQNKRGVS